MNGRNKYWREARCKRMMALYERIGAWIEKR